MCRFEFKFVLRFVVGLYRRKFIHGQGCGFFELPASHPWAEDMPLAAVAVGRGVFALTAVAT